MTAAPVLSVEGLSVEVGAVEPVDRVALSVAAGECLGLVGESGSGKSLTLRAILGLLPPRVRVSAGSVRVDGRTAVVLQEPTAALNPLMRVGDLIEEGCRAAGMRGRRERRSAALELMREVGIPGPEERLRAFPHQLSGGMRQRIVLAMALASRPDVLLCDEPTTALDVTVQRQILALLTRIRRERGLAVVYVSHDLAVVSAICDRVAVMYAGRIVEVGEAEAIFERPAHPYTRGLIASIPRLHGDPAAQRPIGGGAPDPHAFPPGCRFHPRCPMVEADCPQAPHVLDEVGPGHATACIHADRLTGPVAR